MSYSITTARLFAFGLTALSLSLLFATSGKMTAPEKSPAISNLSRDFESQGLSGFLAQKEICRREIARILASDPTASEREMAASRIAIYLFPDLLDDSSFQKQLALDEWVPLETAIEKEPHTAQSRERFEELTADIMIFENARSVENDLSEDAREVIHLYDVLSRP